MVVPPSPNAAALGQFGEYSVSNYTGALNLSIPIYTLQGRSLNHSVSLSYNGSGSRVADVPSWVGLGWNLNCLLYTSPSPRDKRQSRMPSSA